MKIEEKNIRLRKSAQIYRLKKPLSNTKVDEVFVDVSVKKVGNYLFKKVRQELKIHDTILFWSFVSYKICEEPSFLSDTEIQEEKYAYILLVEVDDVLVVSKRYIDGLEKLLERHIEFFEYSKFCHLFAGRTPEYERVHINNMSISNAVIRARAYEGKSLNGIISPTSSSRSIPKNFRMNLNGEIYTLSPKSSRVSKKSLQDDIGSFAVWALALASEIKNNIQESEFIKSFAEPIDLKKVMSILKPIAVFIDLGSLDELVRDGSSRVVICKKNEDLEEELTEEQIDDLFESMSSPLSIEDEGYTVEIEGKYHEGFVSFVFNKTTVSVKSKLLDSLVIKSPNEADLTLTQYINRKRPISAVFNSPKYIYFSRNTFEDKQAINTVDRLMSILDDSYDFSLVKSEKGEPHSSSMTCFPEESLFYAVENSYCVDADGVIICDDLCDEWADHIYIQSKGVNPCISFIHAKHKIKPSQGASALHEVVAQALKNLGRLHADLGAYKKKYDGKWKDNYSSTTISRMRCNSSWKDVESALNRVYGNPNSIRRVILAVPFLEKSDLMTSLNSAKKNGNFKAHQIQYIWLINTFISACKENGAHPLILCKK